MRSLPFLGLAACFSPTPPTGAPCVEDRDCPAPQVCHTVTQTCEASCAGCTPPDGPAPDSDGPPVDTGCWAAWLSGAPVFALPLVRHTELSAVLTSSANPALTNDGLTIYFDRSQDFFRATRESTTESFGPPQLVAELRTENNESKISTTADDRVAVFASARPGTSGLLDLWQAERMGVAGTFGIPSSMLFSAINDVNNQFDPEITPDGLDLYYAPSENNSQTIRHASRAALDDPFANITTVISDDQGPVFDPTISPDQRVLVFAAETGNAPPDLFFVTRPTATAPFGARIELAALNTDSLDADPDLSIDGCTLFFASTRDGLNSIYSVRISP